jgi:hypothetical protein
MLPITATERAATHSNGKASAEKSFVSVVSGIGEVETGEEVIDGEEELSVGVDCGGVVEGVVLSAAVGVANGDGVDVGGGFEAEGEGVAVGGITEGLGEGGMECEGVGDEGGRVGVAVGDEEGERDGDGLGWAGVGSEACIAYLAAFSIRPLVLSTSVETMRSFSSKPSK